MQKPGAINYSLNKLNLKHGSLALYLQEVSAPLQLQCEMIIVDLP
jgi:hypothetical protein